MLLFAYNDYMETSLQQKVQFHEALQQNYSACLFDIDGTLTHRGDEFIPAYLSEFLAEISMRVPMGVCTARIFPQAYEKLAPLFKRAPNPELCQSQWVLVCENGGIGYFYDSSQKKYKEFFRTTYPYDENYRKTIFGSLNKVLEGKLQTSFMGEISMIFRPLRFDDPDRIALAERSREIAKIIEDVLRSLDPKNALRCADSGIGVTVYPRTADKPNGTLEFAKYLQQRVDTSIDEKASQIIVMGDRPGPFGNDEAFLDGTLGTPFSVGELYPDRLLPLPVFDEKDAILQGPEGTLTLLKRLKFVS